MIFMKVSVLGLASVLSLIATTANADEYVAASKDGHRYRSIKRKQSEYYNLVSGRPRSAKPECGFADRTTEGLSDNDSRLDSGFGCSSRSNLHAMMTNKSDAIRGRGARHFDAERAARVVIKYREWNSATPSSTVDNSKATPGQ